MRDIIERLRRRGDRLSKEAAAEIERLRAAFAAIRKAKIGGAIKIGLMAARRRNPDIRLGGWTKGSADSKARADAFAETLRPVMAELQHLSHRAAAAELNRRGVGTALGTQWHGQSVARLRSRLARERAA